jgi:hypothetical protein
MNYNCVRISGGNYVIFCGEYTTRERNLAAAKRAVLALLNETDDYFAPREGSVSIFESDDGKIEFYNSSNGSDE